ncbi:hypothetical protein SDRG_01771 [Saprolegnia diclina VS20]|uniref:Uncharacterized protein n=1 Tax=Saprolegnia diclina (strain VS20) TaxID=1156394 RepID=T0R161_SAPDV|nr:hypothetical protein SDRG_01771 [Saprolegnia diclina VS20]EQC40696.1 hypothetical protein SDRG_01771 [Saprolegnia diclina VS20]|eukprot:XP_008605540.1 hypothetical protein SDRG_01771 [Saprolegnia diclina VS20]
MASETPTTMEPAPRERPTLEYLRGKRDDPNDEEYKAILRAKWSCHVIRSKIRILLARRILSEANLITRMGTTRRAYDDFMALTEPTDGADNPTYAGGLHYFYQADKVDAEMRELRAMASESTAAQRRARLAKKAAEAEDDEPLAPKKKKAKKDPKKDAAPKVHKSSDRLNEIEAVELPEELMVFDDCDEVRDHMRRFFEAKECTQSAMAVHFKFSVGSIRKFLAMRGPRQGSGSIVYKAAYYFFEKLRILEEKPKTAKRIMMEEAMPQGYDLVRDPTYRVVAPLLVADGYTVYTIDLRGSGDSSANFASYTVEDVTADMVAFLRRLPETKVVVVANSFTAACTMLLASSPVASKLAGVVILGPFARDPPGCGPKLFKMIAPAMFPRLYGASMWTTYWKSLFQTPPADFDDYKAFLGANLNQPGRLNALVKLIQASKANAGNAMSSFNLPLVIGMGSLDPDFASPAAEAQFIYDTVQSSWKRISMYKNAKHYPQIDCAEAVRQDVLALLQEVAE